MKPGTLVEIEMDDMEHVSQRLAEFAAMSGPNTGDGLADDPGIVSAQSHHSAITPRFETAAQVWSYLASRGETTERHEHLWVAWDAWADWSWNPHMKRSVLFVCDVPDCLAVRTERVRFAVPDLPRASTKLGGTAGTRPPPPPPPDRG